jgi:ankyrin repeat protein
MKDVFFKIKIEIFIRKNDDQLTPLHQAASEGHVQCMEFLLAHNADVYAEDSRKQSPIDLAKLWGNKKCAKLLAAAMWHQNKHLSAKERLLSRNTKMADLLLEIKREHAILFEEKTEVISKFLSVEISF